MNSSTKWNWLLIIGASFLLNGCVLASLGDDPGEEDSGDETPQAEQCEVDEGVNSTIIYCPDGSTAEIPHGEDGQDGQDGDSCTIVDNDDGTATITCDDGSEVVVETAGDEFNNGDDDNNDEDEDDNDGGEDNGDNGDDNNDDESNDDQGDDESIEFAIHDVEVTVDDNFVAFDFEVTNEGEEDAELFYVDAFVHEDDAPSPGDVGEGAVEFDEGLQAGATASAGLTLLQPDEGTFDGWLVVDPWDNDDAEADVAGPFEYTVDESLPTADLEIHDFDVEVDGTDVIWSAEVTNHGPDDIPPVWVDFYLDESEAPGMWQEGDDFAEVDELDDADSAVVEGVIEDVAPGSYDSWVQVDADYFIDDPYRDDAVAGPVTVEIE